MVRRVVTGHDGAGRSVVVSDDDVAAIPFGTAGGSLHPAWGRDDVAGFPDDGAPPRWREPFPPPGGCRLAVFELPPGDSAEFDEFVSGALVPFADPERPGMHRTPSLDFDVVLAGTVGLELDEGEVTLHPGDVVVQNGTMHRWHNRGATVAQIATVTVGARHEAFPPGEGEQPPPVPG